eukprot:TRINITY_DN755_c0_g1_i1.p2 TRINITY_DN755_c0_g1~~TRINITY_DN755_c0_g1_i1.p2  ORF type:complete len:185 (+),score=75.34 TRINITY_DN755_c0_g1_i1:38-592(+)
MTQDIFFFFKQKTAYEIGVRLVGSEMCIRDRYQRRVHGDLKAYFLQNIQHKSRAREMTRGILRKKATKQKRDQLRFEIDCSQPVEDNVFLTDDFQDFLKTRIKVDGKKGNLGDAVSVSVEDSRIVVTAQAPFSKRYLKYLTKKYLKKQQLRDYLHLISNERNSYQIKYFNIQADEGEEEQGEAH